MFYVSLMKKVNLWECITKTLSAGTCPKVRSRRGKREEGPSGGDSGLSPLLKSGHNAYGAGPDAAKPVSSCSLAWRSPRSSTLDFTCPFCSFPFLPLRLYPVVHAELPL